MKLHRTYYRIRFIREPGSPLVEFHCSNNGTSQWESLAKIKAILTRGIQCGYHGRIVKPFKDYEVVKITEEIEMTTEVVPLDNL